MGVLVFTSVPSAQAAEDWQEETAEVFALGSDGVAHENVRYLTVAEFSSVSQKNREDYIAFCDSIADEADNGPKPEMIEFSVDSKNNIMVTEYSSPVVINGFAEPLQADDAAADDVFESGDMDEAVFDSLFVGDIEKASFKKQLTKDQLKPFNAGYNAVVKNGKTSFSYYGKKADTVLCTALSALILTYPWEFEWLAHGSSLSWTYPCSAGDSNTNVNVTLKKSSWYKKDDEKKAAEIIDKCVDAAEAYAAANTPDNPVYGMVKYMDDWLGQRADYDYASAYSFDDSSKSFYYAHNSYGVLLNGTGVCESYAKAMARFLYKAGIPNAYAIGDAGGPHAWNMIYMPNGNWYVEDATFNDGGYEDTYLLCPSDGRRADGDVFSKVRFKYPSVAYSWYDTDQNEYASDIDISDRSALLEKGKKKTLSVTSKGGYYSKFKQSWKSSNTAVATVSDNGKITAVAPGRTVITMAMAGQRRECEVLVSKIKSVTFEANGKKKLTQKVSVNDSSVTLALDVLSEAGSPTAQVLTENGKLPAVKSSKKKVACVSSAGNAIQVKGDKIYVKLDILKKGSSTITVKYGGKTAKCTLKVKK